MEFLVEDRDVPDGLAREDPDRRASATLMHSSRILVIAVPDKDPVQEEAGPEPSAAEPWSFATASSSSCPSGRSGTSLTGTRPAGSSRPTICAKLLPESTWHGGAMAFRFSERRPAGHRPRGRNRRSSRPRPVGSPGPAGCPPGGARRSVHRLRCICNRPPRSVGDTASPLRRRGAGTPPTTGRVQCRGGARGTPEVREEASFTGTHGSGEERSKSLLPSARTLRPDRASRAEMGVWRDAPGRIVPVPRITRLFSAFSSLSLAESASREASSIVSTTDALGSKPPHPRPLGYAPPPVTPLPIGRWH